MGSVWRVASLTEISPLGFSVQVSGVSALLS